MKFRRSLLVSLPLLIIAAGVVLRPVSASAAADSPQQAGSTSSACCDVDRADDIWLISTRHLGCPSRDKTGDDDMNLHVEHHGGKGVGWLESSLDEFFASS